MRANIENPAVKLAAKAAVLSALEELCAPDRARVFAMEHIKTAANGKSEVGSLDSNVVYALLEELREDGAIEGVKVGQQYQVYQYRTVPGKEVRPLDQEQFPKR